jgi:hypothetical protein
LQIELITNVAKSERFAPNWVDRAWLICTNAGSGALGTGTSREGDVTCLRMVGTTTYTDPDAQTASVGYEAIECNTTNAPPQLMLGAWHDVVDVGGRGRIQCHGWDRDVLVNVGTAADAPGLAGLATTGEPYVEPTAALATAAANVEDHCGQMCTIVELVALMADSTAGNHACFWRT